MNGVEVKGIALTFNLLSWVLHLKPTAVCPILTSIFGIPSIKGEFALVYRQNLWTERIKIPAYL